MAAAERGRTRPDEEKRWNVRTDRMTFTIIASASERERQMRERQGGRERTREGESFIRKVNPVYRGGDTAVPASIGSGF